MRFSRQLHRCRTDVALWGWFLVPQGNLIFTAMQGRALALSFCRYKQKGAEAEAADNVFHHLTYEGAAPDIDAIADPRERAALEAQVVEKKMR